MVLSANRLLGRDENGNLVAQEVHIPELGDVVLMTPVSRGELIRVGADFKAGKISALEIDLRYIEEHLFAPKLSQEQLRQLPNGTVRSLVENLLIMSGVTLRAEDKPSDAIAKAEEELRKK